MPRWHASISGIQLVTKPVPWSKKPAYLRNQPYTAVTPHKGQIQTRVEFGKKARAHKGEKGKKEGLPIIAYYIKKEFKGYKAPDRLSEKEYPSKIRHTFHTLEELEAMLKE